MDAISDTDCILRGGAGNVCVVDCDACKPSEEDAEEAGAVIVSA